MESKQTIIAKHPFDEPGAPRTPGVVERDKDHVDNKRTNGST